MVEKTVSTTGMVVISDLVDDINNIHPLNKQDVGLRLANFALAETYNSNVGAYKSPRYESMLIEQNKIRLSFENVITGLRSTGVTPVQFLIAGNDRIFVNATAKIEGSNIVVSSNEVTNPVAVRFCFDDVSLPDVFSNEGLPLAPFRTDRW
jgi:sialate O-acetylesterase